MIIEFDRMQISEDLVRRSQFESIILPPFFHNLHEVLYLRIVCVLKHLNYFHKPLFRLFACNNHLEHSDGSSSLTFPEFGIWVQSFEHIEGFY